MLSGMLPSRAQDRSDAEQEITCFLVHTLLLFLSYERNKVCVNQTIEDTILSLQPKLYNYVYHKPQKLWHRPPL